MRAYTAKEKAKITAGAVASLVIVGWQKISSKRIHWARFCHGSLHFRGLIHQARQHRPIAQVPPAEPFDKQPAYRAAPAFDRVLR
jgi:hypothetical protein